MYRRIVLYSSKWVSGPVDVLYHVRGAQLLSQRRISTNAYEANFSNVNEAGPAVFADSVHLRAPTGIGTYRTYEFVLDVSSNQPSEESVEEITETGSVITVFNENGVVVCRNTPKTPSSSAPAQAGETTSEPIAAPGDITSELIDNSVETSEPIDGTGETTSEPI